MRRNFKNWMVLISAVVVFLPIAVFGWEYFKDLGGGLDDGRDVDMCADGGLFITGRSNAWAYPDGDFAHNWFDHEMFLIKLDPNGEEEWIRHYGQTGWFIYYSDTIGYYDAGWSVCATPDSGCIIAGKTQSPNYTDPWTGFPDDCPGNDNLLVVRVDKYGDTMWTKSYGGYYFDRTWCVRLIPGTSDFFLVGPTESYGPDMPSTDYENIWIIRIDSVGNIVSQSYWADDTRSGHTDVRWFCLTPDNGIVLVGDTDDHDTTYSDGDSTVTRRICKMVIAKTDSMCNIIWSKVIDRGYFHYCRSVCPYYGGGYLALTYDQNPSRTWMLLFDEDGDTVWTKYIGLDSTGTSVVANYRMIVQAPDSGFYIAGSGGGAARILCTDKELNTRWEALYDYGPLTELLNSCVMTPDSGCFAAGQSYSRYPYDYSDIYAFRVDRDGEDFAAVKETKVSKPAEISISISPNPFNSSCKIAINCHSRENGNPEGRAVLEIYDLRGNIVWQTNLSDSKGRPQRDAKRQWSSGTLVWTPDKSIASGIYLVQATSSGQTIAKRIVYIK